jgi:hypothetical protein
VVKLKVGSKYAFTSKTEGEELLTGRVVELTDEKKCARVELTNPKTNVGNLRELVVGDIVRVYLPIVTYAAA